MVKIIYKSDTSFDVQQKFRVVAAILRFLGNGSKTKTEKK